MPNSIKIIIFVARKYMVQKPYILLLLLLFPQLLFGEVWTYAQPDAKTAESPHFKVNVKQEDTLKNAFVYFSQVSSGDTERSSSWTVFSFSNTIEIEIEVLHETVSAYEIHPKSKNTEAELLGNKLIIKLEEPQKITIEINGNKKRPLFVFADGPEEFIPEKNARGVWRFQPGIHELGQVIVPDTVKHIYIAGGAIVRATLENNAKASGFTITGRGILSAPENAKTGAIVLNGNGKNILVEGITILNAKHQFIAAKQSYATIKNCKLFSWEKQVDGISLGDHGLVENCFFRMNGDAIKLEKNYFTLYNCIFWQNEFGSTFQLGWNGGEDLHNFNVYNCDIIHCEHRDEELNQAIFSSVHGGAAKLSDYHFENIRIQGDVYRLFKLTLRFNMKVKEPGYGEISNLNFKNIWLEGKCSNANEIWGYSTEHQIKNVVFEQLQIENITVRSADEGNFKINLNSTSNIQFR